MLIFSKKRVQKLRGKIFFQKTNLIILFLYKMRLKRWIVTFTIFLSIWLLHNDIVISNSPNHILKFMHSFKLINQGAASPTSGMLSRTFKGLMDP